MSNILARVRAFTCDKRGVTAMEYGMIAALIAVVIIGSISTLGANLKGVFSIIGASI